MKNHTNNEDATQALTTLYYKNNWNLILLHWTEYENYKNIFQEWLMVSRWKLLTTAVLFDTKKQDSIEMMLDYSRCEAEWEQWNIFIDIPSEIFEKFQGIPINILLDCLLEKKPEKASKAENEIEENKDKINNIFSSIPIVNKNSLLKTSPYLPTEFIRWFIYNWKFIKNERYIWNNPNKDTLIQKYISKISKLV